jgi:hypothetical protein
VGYTAVVVGIVISFVQYANTSGDLEDARFPRGEISRRKRSTPLTFCAKQDPEIIIMAMHSIASSSSTLVAAVQHSR